MAVFVPRLLTITLEYSLPVALWVFIPSLSDSTHREIVRNQGDISLAKVDNKRQILGSRTVTCPVFCPFPTVRAWSGFGTSCVTVVPLAKTERFFDPYVTVHALDQHSSGTYSSADTRVIIVSYEYVSFKGLRSSRHRQTNGAPQLCGSVQRARTTDTSNKLLLRRSSGI